MYKYSTGVGSENYLMDMAGNGSSSCSPAHIYPLSYVICSYHIFSLCQLTTLAIHNSLFFTLGSKPTSFTNLSHHRLSSGLRTDSTDFMTGPFLLSISIFVFSFLYYSFCFFWFRVADFASDTSAFGYVKMVYRIVPYAPVCCPQRGPGHLLLLLLLNQ